MGDMITLLLMLAAASVLAVSALLWVPLWRSGFSRKWSYFFLLIWEVWSVLDLDRLYALVGVPFAWQIGVDGVLFALSLATLVLLFRHRHDPDPVDPDRS